MRAGGIHWAATMDAKGFADGAARVKREAKSLMEGLKSAFGRGSGLKEFGEILAGGGVAVGITLAAVEAKKFADEVTNAAVSWHRGELSTGQMIEEIVHGIPFLSQIREAGVSIREAWTAIRTGEAPLAEQAKEAESFMSAIEKSRDVTADIVGEMAKLSANSDFAKVLADIDEGERKALESVNKLRASVSTFTIEHQREFAPTINAMESAIRGRASLQSFNAQEGLLRSLRPFMGVEDLSQNSTMIAADEALKRGIIDMKQWQRISDEIVLSSREYAKNMEDAAREMETISANIDREQMAVNANLQREADENKARWAFLDDVIQRAQELTAPAARPTVALRGSQAAFSALNAPTNRQPTEAQMKELLQHAKDQKQILEDIKDKWEKVADETIIAP